eukprot:m.123908 g.123908  ORF g.123908 m.123908 type:complete len:200 (+) comp16607_c1_seq4:371-970(+)
MGGASSKAVDTASSSRQQMAETVAACVDRSPQAGLVLGFDPSEQGVVNLRAALEQEAARLCGLDNQQAASKTRSYELSGHFLGTAKKTLILTCDLVFLLALGFWCLKHLPLAASTCLLFLQRLSTEMASLCEWCQPICSRCAVWSASVVSCLMSHLLPTLLVAVCLKHKHIPEFPLCGSGCNLQNDVVRLRYLQERRLY